LPSPTPEATTEPTRYIYDPSTGELKPQ